MASNMILQLILKMTDEASDKLKNVAKNADGSTKALLAIGGAAAIGVGVLAKTLASTIGPASDLNETVSKVGVVFGNQAPAIMAFGQTAATALGMSKNEALAAAGTYGNLFRSMGMTTDASANMSMGIVKLAADLGSFNNLPTADVLEKLRAGLTGESEPLKSLGININAATIEAKAMAMGLIGVNGEMTAGAKAQAVYALMLEQTTLAQGDFERTSDGLANRQKILGATMENLKTTIGTALLPAVNAIMGVVLEFAQAAIPAVEAAIVQIQPVFTAVWGAVSSAVSTAMAIIQPIFTALSDWLSGPGTTGIQGFGSTSQSVWTAIQGIIAVVVPLIQGIITTAFGAIATFLTEHGATIQTIITAAWTIISTMIQTAVGVITGIIQMFTALLQGDWQAAWDAVTGIVQTVWTGISTVINTYLGLVQAAISAAWGLIQTATGAVWAAIQGAISGAWAGIQGAVSGAVTAVQGAISGAWAAVEGATTSAWAAITSVLSGAWAGIQNTVGSALGTVQGAISQGWSGIQSAASSAWASISTGIADRWTNIVSGASAGVQNVRTAMGNGWNGVHNAAQSAWTNIVNGIHERVSGLAGFFTGVVNGIKGAWQGLAGFHIPMPHFTAGTTSATVAGITFQVPSIGISWYGQGLPPTLFRGPTLIGVGESGPEVVSVTPAGQVAQGAGVSAAGVTVTGNTFIVRTDADIERIAREIVRQSLRQEGRRVALAQGAYTP